MGRYLLYTNKSRTTTATDTRQTTPAGMILPELMKRYPIKPPKPVAVTNCKSGFGFSEELRYAPTPNIAPNVKPAAKDGIDWALT
jgi:hypothetical protein